MIIYYIFSSLQEWDKYGLDVVNEPVLNKGVKEELTGELDKIVLNVFLLNEPLTISNKLSSLNQGVCINK